MNARYYVPGIGRFASADTIVPDPENPQAWNRYSYVFNNPLRYSDPTGHITEDQLQKYFDYENKAQMIEDGWNELTVDWLLDPETKFASAISFTDSYGNTAEALLVLFMHDEGGHYGGFWGLNGIYEGMDVTNVVKKSIANSHSKNALAYTSLFQDHWTTLDQIPGENIRVVKYKDIGGKDVATNIGNASTVTGFGLLLSSPWSGPIGLYGGGGATAAGFGAWAYSMNPNAENHEYYYLIGKDYGPRVDSYSSFIREPYGYYGSTPDCVNFGGCNSSQW